MAAVTDAYATSEEYRRVYKGSTSDDDPVLDSDLLAVSRHLDHRLGRFFTKDEADIARIYVPSSGCGNTLWIDDLSASPTSIKIDDGDDGSFSGDTALASSDYELNPLNASKGPEPRPYTHIVLTSWGTKGEWPEGQRVEITGKWGWPSVPEAIKRATIELTGILRVESARATSRVDEIGTVIGMSSAAQNIIQRLMDAYVRPGAG